MRISISVEHCVAITLWCLATPCEYRTVGHLFGVARCTVCVIVHDTCNAINTVFSKDFVCFPVGSQLTEVIDGFKEKWGIIQCAGAIDGSHIPVSAPAGNHTDYYNRKALVSLTALIGYTLAPAPFHLPTVLLATAGTALCSAGAMAFNHWVEVPYDSQMARTRNRVLVKGLISPLHAVVYGVSAGLAGTALLWYTVNPLTAVLGFGNLLLYSSCYTPLKRISIANTWVGALVGAIPPLMGWTACTGSLDTGAFVLAGVLYAWQFPHFNALSWRLRGDYSRAGYRMMSVLNPGLCKRTSLRYSISLLPICTMAPVLDITTWWFVLDSLPVNGWLVYLSWRFYRDSDFKSARKLFHFTLFHLPLLMGLILINKKHWNSAEMAAQKPPTTTASYSTFDTSLP